MINDATNVPVIDVILKRKCLRSNDLEKAAQTAAEIKATFLSVPTLVIEREVNSTWIHTCACGAVS